MWTVSLQLCAALCIFTCTTTLYIVYYIYCVCQIVNMKRLKIIHCTGYLPTRLNNRTIKYMYIHVKKQQEDEDLRHDEFYSTTMKGRDEGKDLGGEDMIT